MTRENQGKRHEREVSILSLMQNFYFNSGFYDRTIGEGVIRREYDTWKVGDQDLYEAGRMSAVVYGKYAITAPSECALIWALHAFPTSLRGSETKITTVGGQRWDPAEAILLESFGTLSFEEYRRRSARSLSGPASIFSSSPQQQRWEDMQSRGYSFEDIEEILNERKKK